MTTWAEARTGESDGGLRQFEVPADWAQGRACFGGLVAAYGLDAIAGLAGLGAARSVSVDFVAPLSPGPARARASVLRRGKYLNHVRAEVWQQGRICATVLQASGQARATKVQVTAPSRPAAAAPETLPDMPYVKRVMPAFLQHFDVRWAVGSPPFSGAADPVVGGWVRLREPAESDVPLVLAMIDAWPSPVLTTLTSLAAASTVTWHTNLVDVGGAGSGWWYYAAEVTSAGEGYVDATASLWGPEGQLVARSTQLVAEFS